MKYIQSLPLLIILVLVLRNVYLETGEWTTYAIGTIIYMLAQIGFIVKHWSDTMNTIMMSKDDK